MILFFVIGSHWVRDWNLAWRGFWVGFPYAMLKIPFLSGTLFTILFGYTLSSKLYPEILIINFTQLFQILFVINLKFHKHFIKNFQLFSKLNSFLKIFASLDQNFPEISRIFSPNLPRHYYSSPQALTTDLIDQTVVLEFRLHESSWWLNGWRWGRRGKISGAGSASEERYFGP